MGTKSPQVSKIIYFFGNVAFKINAINPAGIKPVVSNSFNLIPKSGIWATNSGKAYKPIPKDIEIEIWYLILLLIL